MTTHIKFCNAANLGGTAVEGKPRAVQTITESGTSQASTITAEKNEIAVITATAAILVNYGPGTPVAASGSGDLIPAGARIVVALNEGDKVAVITA